jgi:hypothetical protein
MFPIIYGVKIEKILRSSLSAAMSGTLPGMNLLFPVFINIRP